MEHSYSGDLQIQVKCPNEQTMELLPYPNSLGSHFLGEPVDSDLSNTFGEGYEYCFSSSATTGFQDVFGLYQYDFTDNDGNSYTNHNYIPEGEYAPTGDFNELVSCPLNGQWEIIIRDNLASDNGVVFKWDISLYGSSITEWSGENIDDVNNDTTYAIPTTTGWQDYTYFIQNEYGCIYDTTIAVYVDGNVKVNEIKNKNETWVIHPNPAHDFVIIVSEAWQSQIRLVELYNMQWQLVKEFKIDNSEIKIPISDLQKGIYLVKIGIETKKLIVE